jgi:hypothetical protein
MPLDKLIIMGRKTLSIDEETYNRIKEYGKFGESFDELFNRILNEIDESRKMKSKK